MNKYENVFLKCLVALAVVLGILSYIAEVVST